MLNRGLINFSGKELPSEPSVTDERINKTCTSSNINDLMFHPVIENSSIDLLDPDKIVDSAGYSRAQMIHRQRPPQLKEVVH